MGLIRLLLALSVVFEHSGPFFLTGTHFVGGLVAVEAFFIISGFYMALVMDARYANNRAAFYQNRFLRIFPTYWAILFLAIVVRLSYGGETMVSSLMNEDFSTGTMLLMFFSNLMIFGSDMMMFLSNGTEGLYFTANFHDESVQLYKYHYIPQAWTLPVELMFYLIVPFFCRKNYIIVTLLLISLAIKSVTLLAFGWIDPWVYRFFPSELMMFCLGMLSHRIYHFLKGGKIFDRLGEIALLAIVTFTVMFESIGGNLQMKMVAYFLLLVLLIPVIFYRFRRSRFDRLIGELSYPIYLCHLIIIGAVNYFDISIMGDRSSVYILGSMMMAWLVHHFISEPIEHRFKAK